ncbi:HmuY family protein [Weeksellaceae bacterium TAE3-ERU29]|nr:HmuY family protein [Weeksellaceae bacterium TAE3-ERU29]
MKKFCLALCSALLFVSCSSDDEKNPESKSELTVNTVKTDARKYDAWVYYSIETGKEVEVSDSKNSLNWDIAFHRNNVRLNGGESGKGKGEAVKLDEKDLSKVVEAPTSGYVKDTEGTIVIAYVMPAPKFGKEPFNKAVSWLDIDTRTPPPIYTLQDNVFVIKTANGKYAKIKFLSYKGDRNENLIITWQYAFQKDGSTNLK